MPHGVKFRSWWSVIKLCGGRFLPHFQQRAEWRLARKFRLFEPARRFSTDQWRAYR